MDVLITVFVHAVGAVMVAILMTQAYKWGHERGKEEALEELKELYWTYRLEDEEGNKA